MDLGTLFGIIEVSVFLLTLGIILFLMIVDFIKRKPYVNIIVFIGAILTVVFLILRMIFK